MLISWKCILLFLAVYLSQARDCTNCANCVNHQSNSYCLQCKNSYYRSSETDCLACRQNCASCSKWSQCGTCASGFSFSDGACMSDSPWYMPIISASILIVAAIVLSCLCREFLKYHKMCCYKQTQTRQTGPIDETQTAHWLPTDIKISGWFSGEIPKKPVRCLGQLSPGNYNMEEICVICLEKDTFIVTNCKHYFHVRCLTDWWRRNGDCPVCRTPAPSPLLLRCLCGRSCTMTDFINLANAQNIIRDQCPHSRLKI